MTTIKQKIINSINAGTLNWEKESWAVGIYCPEHIDKKRFNWKKHGWTVKKYNPLQVYFFRVVSFWWNLLKRGEKWNQN